MKNNVSIFDVINNYDLKALEILLSRPIDLRIYEPEREDTPLHLAIRNEQNDIVDLLLEAKAPLEAKNKYNDTPLHIASMKGNKFAVQALMNLGAKKNLHNNNNELPIDLAQKFGHVIIIELLSEKK